MNDLHERFALSDSVMNPILVWSQPISFIEQFDYSHMCYSLWVIRDLFYLTAAESKV